LLIAGADRNALDNLGGKPIQYVAQSGLDGSDKLASEIYELLLDKWTLLGDFLMIRATFKKQKKNSYTLLLYCILMSFSFFCLYNSSFYILKIHGGYNCILYINYCLFVLTVIFCFAVWATEPGYLKKIDGFDWVEMLEEFENSSLCPECSVLKTPRSRHCNLCMRCVDRFDHHCPWVNNCIGRRNYKYFYAFVVS